MIANPFNRRILNLILFVGLLYITGSILLSEENIQGLRQVIFDADILFYGLGILAFTGIWICDSWAVKVILHKYGHTYSLKQALQAVVTGQFYHAITPLASGGQPVQIYYMVRKDGIPLWAATSAVFNRLILYKLMLIIYALIGVAWQFSRLTDVLGGAFAFTVVGLVLSVGIAVGAIAMFLKPRLVARLAFRILRLLNRVAPPEVIGLREEKLEQLVLDYAAGIGVLVKEKTMLLQVCALMIGNLTFQFVSAYFVYRAMGFQGESIWTFLAFQAVLTVTIFFIPTPGNLGAAEYGFYLFYSGIYPTGSLMVAVLLWRSMTYYYKVLVSAAVALWTYWMHRRTYGEEETGGPLALIREQLHR